MADLSHIIRGVVVRPKSDGGVDVFVDGAIACDEKGTFTFIGEYLQLVLQRGDSDVPVRSVPGAILPPFLDAHIHIPQHPIRGHFTEGVVDHPPEGRLLAGLNRNVFPAEAKCSNRDYTEAVVRRFLGDTLRNGVVGGAAYMTVHADAVRIALSILPEIWHVGLVLMNQNCPENLRTDEANLSRDIESLASEFGPRLIVTDRFAVATSTALRRAGAGLAKRLNLRTQTHLNEQVSEKRFVETVLYPDAGSYTSVYARDGLLTPGCILAHCIHMRPDEWKQMSDSGAVVAHCPTSNALLGSGIMNLDEIKRHPVDYAICTDVGASPTTSLLAEARQFLDVHAGLSHAATPEEALCRITAAPSRMLGLERVVGRLEVGLPMSLIEVDLHSCDRTNIQEILSTGLFGPSRNNRADLQTLAGGTEDHATLTRLAATFGQIATDHAGRVNRVYMSGKVVYERPAGVRSAIP